MFLYAALDIIQTTISYPNYEPDVCGKSVRCCYLEHYNLQCFRIQYFVVSVLQQAPYSIFQQYSFQDFNNSELSVQHLLFSIRYFSIQYFSIQYFSIQYFSTSVFSTLEFSTSVFCTSVLQYPAHLQYFTLPVPFTGFLTWRTILYCTVCSGYAVMAVQYYTRTALSICQHGMDKNGTDYGLDSNIF